jgi:hypothetical protein
MGTWDSFKPSGDFPENRMRFENVGDQIVGTVTNIRFPEFDGEKVPELWLVASDGSEWQVTASQMNLQTRLHEARPEVNDQVAITLVGFRPAARPGRSPSKQFEVQVRRAEPASSWPQQSPSPAPQPAPPPPPPAASPEPFPARNTPATEPPPPAASGDIFANLPPRR